MVWGALRGAVARGGGGAAAAAARPRAYALRGTASAAARRPLLSTGAARVIAPASLTSWTGAPRHARAFSSGGDVKEIVTPDFGAESITEGNIQEWQKKVGDFCAEGEVIVIIETDKVSVEVRATENGTLTEILAQPEDTVEVGQPLAKFSPGGEAPPAAAPKAEEPKAAAAPAAETAPPPKAAPTPAPAAAADPVPAAAGGPSRGERRVKMTRMRKTIARTLKESQNTATMLTTFQEVDMSAILDLRKKYKDEFEASHGVKLGFMGAFAKASAFALQQMPAINGVIDDATQEIVYRDYIDISVAVASPKGLVVPVVRNCESKSINQIESGIMDLAMKARKDELGVDEMAGGTFTITNGGVFGSMLSTPIINRSYGGQSAILGMHATKPRPVVLKSGEIAVRPIMYLALTYDHRLVDGRESVTFLCTVRDQIEDPRRLILEC